jgi:adenosine deaminase
VIELAQEYGYKNLPTTDEAELASWFNRGAKRNDLVLYLETFAHTVGVMQHRDAIERVAYECAQDLAADGVVYAEVRMAPELCTEQGLTLDEVVEAMLAGFRARLGGHRPHHLPHLLGDAHRCPQPRDRRAGGALARPPAWWASTSPAPRPATRPRATSTRSSTCSARTSTHHPRRRGVRAAEHLGGRAVLRRRAARPRGADRRRHHRPPGEEQLGRLAAFVRDRRIPLELCPTSNVGTGVCASIAEHPIGMLRRLRFRVTLNTDNRLMSATSMTYEMEQLHDAFGWGLDDFEWITINAMKSAFAPFPERLKIINGIIKPRYAADGRGGSGRALKAVTGERGDTAASGTLPACP